MANDSAIETRGFETEAKQLLQLMIHSLYSNREIFLRELISNASDAADKLRFEALSNPELLADDVELSVTIETNKKAGTISITDNGIGMTKEDVISHLGTIARSGTAQFLKTLTGDQQKDSHLIGQFGVGFYSAFIVAEEVEVLTRRAGTKLDEGVIWKSKGEAEYTVASAEKAGRGTTVTLHLKKDAREFLDDFRLRSIVKKYADHISIPVMMEKPDYTAEADKKSKSKDAQKAFETVNSAKALWTRPRKELKENDYKEFYKHVSHDFEDPLEWSHNKVEGKLDYTSLLYIPGRAPFDLWNREAARGLKLYVKRVFIMDDARQFLPLYLRFIKGVVDSSDISLNVSREILQKDPVVDSMRSALTKRALDMLEKLMKKNREKYVTFWNEFGQALKEGPAEDSGNKDKVAGLLLFLTTESKGKQQDQSLTEYVSRMKEGQDKIYFLVAESLKSARTSPHLEIFRKKGIEVILMHDRIDEWLISYLNEFDSKPLQDITRGELNLGKLEDSEEKAKQKTVEKEFESLISRVKAKLGDKVQDVRLTHRLTESPACLAVGEHDMGEQMRKIMQASGQKVPDSKPIFELNPEHPLVVKLDKEAEEDRVNDLIEILFDQAALAEGRQLEDPGSYTRRLNKLLLELCD